MTLGYTRVTAMDVGVGESCPGNAGRESTTRGSHGVVGSPPPNAQGGALLPEVPTDPREEIDAAAEAEETHVVLGRPTHILPSKSFFRMCRWQSGSSSAQWHITVTVPFLASF